MVGGGGMWSQLIENEKTSAVPNAAVKLTLAQFSLIAYRLSKVPGNGSNLNPFLDIET